jgi:hypothetical protein
VGVVMAKIVICPVCKKEIESRSRMASDTLVRHMKGHK